MKTAIKILVCSFQCFALLSTTGSPAVAGEQPSQPDIVETAVSAGSFETLTAALTRAGLVEALKGRGPFTVFAPTDEAFAELPQGTVDNLLQPENVDRLKSILTYHVVSGEVSSRQAVALDSAETLNGQRVEIAFRDGRLSIGGAGVVKTDIEAENGIIHVIDTVLLPPEVIASRELISLAIERGVPLFNSGQRSACAAIYEVAARGLLDGFSDELDESMRSRLRAALDDIRSTHDAGRQAWILRHALDEVYQSLG